MIDAALKQRLVGATVLVSLAVIFIPMLLDGTDPTEDLMLTSNIPERPDNQFKSRIVPVAPTEIPVEVEAEESDKSADASDTAAQEVAEETEIPTSLPLADVDKSVRSAVTAWVVQLGSFSDKANASKLETKLRTKGFPAFVDPVQADNITSFKVRVGPELSEQLAKDLAAKIESSVKMKGIVVKYP